MLDLLEKIFEEGILFVVVAVIIGLLFAVICAIKAWHKEYSVALWFLGGLCFTLLAALVIDALPDRSDKAESPDKKWFKSI